MWKTQPTERLHGFAEKKKENSGGSFDFSPDL